MDLAETELLEKITGHMQDRLEANSHKRNWRFFKTTELLDHLKDEVRELERALINGENVWHEAADVANLAAMVADSAYERE